MSGTNSEAFEDLQAASLRVESISKFAIVNRTFNIFFLKNSMFYWYTSAYSV